MPVSAAGWRIEPPVSVPSEIGTPPAATVAAEPPEEPPGTRSRSHGLRVGPNAECSVEEPIANSSMLALPTKTASCSRRRATTVQSMIGTKRSSIREPAVVWTPFVESTSLSASGMPVSGAASPARSRSSAASACASAASSVIVM